MPSVCARLFPSGGTNSVLTARTWTYAALDDAIQRAAAVLESHGVEQGQRIAALARNSADLV
ncbi:AMP-binding protein, partial [Mesorhizobium sp. M4B.F.Ca.ET.190.01.1.1]|uniref:AMP-binding protein n=1 Tax=Mesorhizobium sp. M4B.F.Ca.ET.190.01.1.1 TaxID=2563951 RepID=UPI001AEE2561